MKIQRQNNQEVWIEEGIFVTEILNDPKSPGLSVARCRLPGRLTTQNHKLCVDEWYIIEAGQGVMSVGEQSFPVGPGDTVMIARGTAQKICNSLETDLVFQVICTPRFTPECYEALSDALDI